MGNRTTRRWAGASRAIRWASLALRIGLAGAILAASTTAVLGQDDDKAVKKIIEINKKALAAIDAREFDSARDGLSQAVTLAKQANLLNHKMLARTYVHLGAVYFMGFNDRKSATRYFGLAKGVRADINLTPSLATPDLTALFDAATAGGSATDTAAVSPKPVRRPPPPPSAPTPPPTTAPSPEPTVAPSPPPLAGEPDLPAELPADLYCPAVEEAPEGQDLVIRCAAKPSLKAERVFLYYRASGAPSYSVAAMQISDKGWLAASIPGEAVTGESLQYYCEAHDSADNVVATNGQEELPNPIIVKPGAPGATPATTPAGAGGKGDGEDPLRRIKDQQDSEVQERRIHRRRQFAVWVGAAWGTGGIGYHRASYLEWKGQQGPVIKAGWHTVGWETLYPEVGFLVTDHIGVAVQGRLEFIQTQGTGDSQGGRPANGAISVLGRGLYYLDLGAGNAQFQFSLDFGGGDGYRYAYPPTTNAANAQCVKNSKGACQLDASGNIVIAPGQTLLTDTVRSGPWLYGAGVGFIYHFTTWFALNTDVRVLGAGPHLGLLFETYTSLQFSPYGGRAPAKLGDAPPTERVIEDEDE